jgi:hypothetical protein
LEEPFQQYLYSFYILSSEEQNEHATCIQHDADFFLTEGTNNSDWESVL